MIRIKSVLKTDLTTLLLTAVLWIRLDRVASRSLGKRMWKNSQMRRLTEMMMMRMYQTQRMK